VVRAVLPRATKSPQGRNWPSARARGSTRLKLLSSFQLAFGEEPVVLPPSVQRLVAFLAVCDRPMLRQSVAGTLWPETSEGRAAANLRSALWRLNRLEVSIIEARGMSLRLDASVHVDLRDRTEAAQTLLSSEDPDFEWFDESGFGHDLLPDWYDDWLVVTRERFHQLRLRALEFVCEGLAARGQYARALDAGLAALAGEPLRESAHRALVRVHIAEGNPAEAVRQFELYRRLLRDQLGLTPSLHIIELLHV
jgi:DNA-binding SARP family transcriptional activator